ncbi:MAG: DUF1513 domain-containing protein [Rhizobacter sp.]
MIDRRHWLAFGAAQALTVLADPVWARTASPRTRLAAAWQTPGGAQVGVLDTSAQALRVAAAINVPSRAHGIVQEPGGTLLAVARRPGDWLMRWSTQGKQLASIAAEPNRAFNGHVLCNASGDTLFTTETDLDSGAGLIVVRDARTLARRAEWPTHGIDPHMLLWDVHAAPGTRLLVANGGIEIQPETGRMKLHLDRMDSSLVRLDARNGALLGQWRVPDRRLSLRHLAWTGRGDSATLGIAMQAEHDDKAAQQAAPVLAVFADDQLRVASLTRELAGYGGDIAATPSGWALSCPRAQGVSMWRNDGEWLGFAPLAEACALAVDPRDDSLWMGGSGKAAHASESAAASASFAIAHSVRADNHWVRLQA